MKIEKTITVNWWANNVDSITTHHRDQLEEIGFTHALEMLKEGFTSGELSEDLEGIEYSGWFELNTKVIE